MPCALLCGILTQAYKEKQRYVLEQKGGVPVWLPPFGHKIRELRRCALLLFVSIIADCVHKNKSVFKTAVVVLCRNNIFLRYFLQERGVSFMEKLQSETALEQKHLEETIAIANGQLEAAKRANEDAKEKLIEAKRELRENNSHAFANLYSSEAFEALGELSQELDPLLMSISDYEEVEKKIVQLKKLIESPYFARIDFRFEDEEEY